MVDFRELGSNIYFFDPNGHRLELTYDDNAAEGKISMITEAMKQEMLDEWSRTKRAPAHTQFLHAEELAEAKQQVPLGE